MKISKIYSLNKTQYELDFVDIDVKRDIKLFLDPYFLSVRGDPWSINTTRTIQSFFRFLINLLRAGKTEEARELFSYLHEPNETRLGLSKKKPQGRGIGDSNANAIFESILQSRAVETGLIEDIEDAAIFVEDIGKDKMSDMTTNIIRKHLIDYTQAQCKLWDIPLTPDVPSGFFWDSARKRWLNIHTEMLVVDNEKLLLVPKGIVSYYNAYTDQKYHQHFVLNFLQHEHLRLNTVLVRREKRKDKSTRVYVTKKDVVAHEAPRSKEFLREFTNNHPEVFSTFRKEVKRFVNSIPNEEFENVDIPDLVRYLLNELRKTPAGRKHAEIYQKLMVGILEFIFYPKLINPQPQHPINQRRKIIDITFDNAAKSGIFHRLHSVHHITSGYIIAECKNYNGDPANPELDQLIGRFSVNHSKVGLLICRNISNLELFLERCRDTYRSSNDLIVPITDQDIMFLLNSISDKKADPEEQLLTDRIRAIILS